jgi:hypothetical protein
MIILAALKVFGGAAAVAGGATVATSAIRVAVLTLGAVLAWFRARRATFAQPGLVATTIVDLLASGEYRTVQGVFNNRTRQWGEYRTVESSQLGYDLARLHQGKRVVYHTMQGG